MKRASLFFCMALSCSGTFAQITDSLSLFSCLRMAGERSPLTGQKYLSGKAMEYKIKNLSSNWFPAIDLNAQANYASETVHFSDYLKDLPVTISIPPLPLDQYKVWAEISQKIYDGGITRAQKSIERASYEAELQQVETDLWGVKRQVNQSFFALLIARKSDEILQVSLDELREKKKAIRAGIDNGVLLPENMLSMDAEELRLQQMLLELKVTQEQLLDILSILMDTTISAQVTLIQPGEPIDPDQQILRPEYMLFAKQKEMLQASKSLVTAADMPRFFAYSQGAYGRPGYNFLSRDFHAFYSVGVGMKWDFLHYGDSRRQKKIFEIQKGIVDIRQKTFDDQLDIQLQAEKSSQAKYTELLKQDEEILRLRKAIAAASFAKLTHGTLTSTDYLTEQNRAILAGLQYENHKILKLQAVYNYLLLQGKL